MKESKTIPTLQSRHELSICVFEKSTSPDQILCLFEQSWQKADLTLPLFSVNQLSHSFLSMQVKPSPISPINWTSHVLKQSETIYHRDLFIHTHIYIHVCVCVFATHPSLAYGLSKNIFLQGKNKHIMSHSLYVYTDTKD